MRARAYASSVVSEDASDRALSGAGFDSVSAASGAAVVGVKSASRPEDLLGRIAVVLGEGAAESAESESGVGTGSAADADSDAGLGAVASADAVAG